MCGICGMVDFGGYKEEATRKTITKMMTAMTHRGPDDAGMFVARKAALGMRRLSVIDLQTGHQPLVDASSRYTIVFNGELYNFKELRLVLEGIGYVFATKTDTEVILYAYIEFGAKCVELFNGMFAFAIWDNHAEVLFGARDRFGIKPLYASVTNPGKFVFASELRSLISSPEIQRRIDLVSLSHFLSFEYIPSPQSALRNVIKISPATRFTFSHRGFEEEQYWSPSFVRSENRPPTFWNDYVPELDRRFRQSVAMELVSDVPRGIFLSGGLDSSTIAYYAAHEARQNSLALPTCYSVRFSESSFDESSYAQDVARHIGLPHRILTLDDTSLIKGVEEAVASIDEPFADPSFVPTLLLSKFAREDVKVVLGGDGGDELFAGYPTYQAHRAIELYERVLPRAIRASIIPALVSLLPTSDHYLSIDFKLKRFLAGRGLPTEVRHHMWLGSFSPADQKRLLTPSRSLSELDPYEPARKLFEQSDARAVMNKILFCDMRLYLEGNILAKVDRASMLSSLEARVPILNNLLTSFVLEVPFEFKLKYFKTKFLLRKLMAGRLPHSILHRRKQGFGFPVGRLLKGPLKPLILSILDPKKLKRQDIFNPKEVHALLEHHWSGKYDLRKQIWTLLMFQSWYDRTIESV